MQKRAGCLQTNEAKLYRQKWRRPSLLHREAIDVLRCWDHGTGSLPSIRAHSSYGRRVTATVGMLLSRMLTFRMLMSPPKKRPNKRLSESRFRGAARSPASLARSTAQTKGIGLEREKHGGRWTESSLTGVSTSSRRFCAHAPFDRSARACGQFKCFPAATEIQRRHRSCSTE